LYARKRRSFRSLTILIPLIYGDILIGCDIPYHLLNPFYFIRVHLDFWHATCSLYEKILYCLRYSLIDQYTISYFKNVIWFLKIALVIIPLPRTPSSMEWSRNPYMDRNNKTEIPGKTIAGGCQAHAQQSLIALIGAFKKILLYPSDHVIYQTSLESLKGSLDSFFENHGDLVLKIERHQIRYKNEMVHEGPMSEENLAFILFRDGVYHLEFKESIALWEIHRFLEILKEHQVLTEDAENDIVTSLWGMELPSLIFKAEDVGFDTGEEFEIPELGEDEPSQDTPEKEKEDTIDTPPPPPFETPIQNRQLWEITPEDREHLRNMIVEEEDWERIEYVLYILLFILDQQTQPDDFADVMAFLNQELQEAMQDHNYQSVHNTFQILKKNIDRHKSNDHWSVPLLKDFFASVSSKTFLNVLQDDWDNIADSTPDDLAYLKRALVMLDAEAVETLGPMLLETTSNQTKNILMVVIGILAEREFEYFDKLLWSSNSELQQLLIHVIGFMKNKASFQRLPDLLGHESADVRKETLKAIYRRNPKMLSELKSVMHDTDEEVQELFLKFASQHRDVRVEMLLLDYLQNQRIRAGNRRFLSKVYMCLGKCGSDESLPFLKKDLFFWSGFGILRSKKSLRRQAAEYALREINSENAKLMLNKSSKS
jgi:hypothetical protein